MAKTKVTKGLIVQANNFQMGEQPLAVRDAISGRIVEVTILVDEDGNMIRPLKDDGTLELILDELRTITQQLKTNGDKL